MSRIDLILFDVNETLLDLRAMQPRFAQAFGDAGATSRWFAQLLRSAFVATIADTYADFSVLAADALEMVAQREGVVLSAETQRTILDQMRHLPPHADVPDGLRRLQNAGYRLATLTNSPPHVLADQITHAGLTPYFDRLLSVDAVRRFKPHRSCYAFASAELDVPLTNILFVAAHDWDVHGAHLAGCQTAFIARPGMVMGAQTFRPPLVVPDLGALADAIVV